MRDISSVHCNAMPHAVRKRSGYAAYLANGFNSLWPSENRINSFSLCINLNSKVLANRSAEIGKVAPVVAI